MNYPLKVFPFSQPSRGSYFLENTSEYLILRRGGAKVEKFCSICKIVMLFVFCDDFYLKERKEMSYSNLLRMDGEPIKEENYGKKEAKKVLCHKSFYDDRYETLTTEQFSDLNEIVSCMEKGKLIPNKFIRNTQKQSHNHILYEVGVHHLHLTDCYNNDTLLYYLEYKNWYVLLCIAGHQDYLTESTGSKALLKKYNAAVHTMLQHVSWNEKKDSKKISDASWFIAVRIKLEKEEFTQKNINDVNLYNPRRKTPRCMR